MDHDGTEPVLESGGVPAEIQPITKIQSALLYILWRQRRGGDGRLFNAEQLLTEIRSLPNSADFRDLDERKLKKPLRRLVDSGLVEIGATLKGKESSPGPAPMGFRLPEGGALITWQSTARLVLELFNYPRRPIRSERFTNEMVQLGVTEDDTGKPWTREDIQRQLDFCSRKGYIRINREADAQSLNAGTTLQSTSLIDQHLGYLELIASRRAPQASAEEVRRVRTQG